MTKALNEITKNSIFTMVDLFLGYGLGEPVESYEFHIADFVVHCFNLEKDQPEYEAVRVKFSEEFENSRYFEKLKKEEATKTVSSTINVLLGKSDIPEVIQEALDKSY